MDYLTPWEELQLKQLRWMHDMVDEHSQMAAIQKTSQHVDPTGQGVGTPTVIVRRKSAPEQTSQPAETKPAESKPAEPEPTSKHGDASDHMPENLKKVWRTEDAVNARKTITEQASGLVGDTATEVSTQLNTRDPNADPNTIRLVADAERTVKARLDAEAQKPENAKLDRAALNKLVFKKLAQELVRDFALLVAGRKVKGLTGAQFLQFLLSADARRFFRRQQDYADALRAAAPRADSAMYDSAELMFGKLRNSDLMSELNSLRRKIAMLTILYRDITGIRDSNMRLMDRTRFGAGDIDSDVRSVFNARGTDTAALTDELRTAKILAAKESIGKLYANNVLEAMKLENESKGVRDDFKKALEEIQRSMGQLRDVDTPKDGALETANKLLNDPDITRRLEAVNTLLEEAAAIQSDLGGSDQQLSEHFPKRAVDNARQGKDDVVRENMERLQTMMDRAMGMQEAIKDLYEQVAASVGKDASEMSANELRSLFATKSNDGKLSFGSKPIYSTALFRDNLWAKYVRSLFDADEEGVNTAIKDIKDRYFCTAK